MKTLDAGWKAVVLYLPLPSKLVAKVIKWDSNCCPHSLGREADIQDNPFSQEMPNHQFGRDRRREYNLGASFKCIDAG